MDPQKAAMPKYRVLCDFTAARNRATQISVKKNELVCIVRKSRTQRWALVKIYKSAISFQGWIPTGCLRTIKEPNILTPKVKVKKAKREAETCAICLSKIVYPVTTRCNHTFCRGCLDEEMNHRRTCPMCRGSLEDYRRNVRVTRRERLHSELNMLTREISTGDEQSTIEQFNQFADQLVRILGFELW